MVSGRPRTPAIWDAWFACPAALVCSVLLLLVQWCFIFRAAERGAMLCEEEGTGITGLETMHVSNIRSDTGI